MPRSDMFLNLEGRMTGAVRGESNDRQFRGQIEVIDWSWSGERTRGTGGGSRATAALLALGHLKVIKRVDSATTPLVHAMSTGEDFSTFELTIRKAGGAEPLPFFVVRLGAGRIWAYEVNSQSMPDGPPELIETVSFGFDEIEFDYTTQTGAGGRASSSSATLHTRHAA